MLIIGKYAIASALVDSSLERAIPATIAMLTVVLNKSVPSFLVFDAALGRIAWREAYDPCRWPAGYEIVRAILGISSTKIQSWAAVATESIGDKHSCRGKKGWLLLMQKHIQKILPEN